MTTSSEQYALHKAHWTSGSALMGDCHDAACRDVWQQNIEAGNRRRAERAEAKAEAERGPTRTQRLLRPVFIALWLGLAIPLFVWLAMGVTSGPDFHPVRGGAAFLLLIGLVLTYWPVQYVAGRLGVYLPLTTSPAERAEAERRYEAWSNSPQAVAANDRRMKAIVRRATRNAKRQQQWGNYR